MSLQRTSQQLTRYVALRQEVLDFDGYKCRKCGRSKSEVEALHTNHLIPVAGNFDKYDTFNNLITLCNDCHSLVHARQQAFLSPRLAAKLWLSWERFRRTLPYEITEESVYAGLAQLGKGEFRPGQLEAVTSALKGRSVLFVSPTGSGKSLCYQLPALLKPGLSVVLSPLNALMSDQVQQMLANGIPTTYINSTLDKQEKNKRYNLLFARSPKLYFCTPERFINPRTSEHERLIHQKLRPDFLVIDEAHVVPSWGMSFRPAYRRIQEIRQQLGNPPIIALTATATPESQQRILHMLGIEDAKIIINQKQRTNITLVKRKLTPHQMEHVGVITAAIEGNPGKTIVFVPTIKGAQELHSKILAMRPDWQDVLAVYHSEKDAQDKEFIEARFAGRNHPALRCIIATSAFGMGIDIPDIGLVVHYGCPSSIDDYVQGIGRAGRNGKRAAALLLYTDEDAGKWVWIKNKGLERSDLSAKEKREEQKRIRQDMNLMMGYAGVQDICLQDYIGQHFKFSQSYRDKLKKWWLRLNSADGPKEFCCSNCYPELLRDLDQMIKTYES